MLTRALARVGLSRSVLAGTAIAAAILVSSALVAATFVGATLTHAALIHTAFRKAPAEGRREGAPTAAERRARSTTTVAQRWWIRL